MTEFSKAFFFKSQTCPWGHKDIKSCPSNLNYFFNVQGLWREKYGESKFSNSHGKISSTKKLVVKTANNYGVKKFGVKKKKKLGVKKNWGEKNFGVKKWGYKKIGGEKKLGVKKYWMWKKIGVKKKNRG